MSLDKEKGDLYNEKLAECVSFVSKKFLEVNSDCEAKLPDAKELSFFLYGVLGNSAIKMFRILANFHDEEDVMQLYTKYLKYDQDMYFKALSFVDTEIQNNLKGSSEIENDR